MLYIESTFFPPLREQDIVIMSHWKDYTCETTHNTKESHIYKVKGVKKRNLNPKVKLTRTDRVLAPAR
jgi:hypothetical protein